jgi:hypothetical protein
MQDDVYTFLCAANGGAPLFMDRGIFDSAYSHAITLLDQHRSAGAIAVWRSALLIEKFTGSDVERQASPAVASGR